MSGFIVIHKDDNVLTALDSLQPSLDLLITTGHENQEIVTKELIPFGHKCAIRDITKGDKVIKYGEIIGIATEDIHPGEHVHVHNLRSIRGTIKEEPQ